MPPVLRNVCLNTPNVLSLSSSGIPNPDMESLDSHTSDDVIKTTPSTPPLIHFVLENFFLAMFSISLTLFIIFFVMAWLTAPHHTRLMKEQVLPDVNAVSLHIHAH